MNDYLNVLKKYAVFSGRSRRREYWMFVLFNFIFAIVIGVLEGVIGTGGVIAIVYNLAIFIPAIAVSVRRLHDIEKSGWWILISIVPLIGAIVLLVFMCLDSTPGDNKYGANPKI